MQLYHKPQIAGHHAHLNQHTSTALAEKTAADPTCSSPYQPSASDHLSRPYPTPFSLYVVAGFLCPFYGVTEVDQHAFGTGGNQRARHMDQ